MWYRTQSAEAVSDDLHRDHAALNFVEHEQYQAAVIMQRCDTYNATA